MTLKQQIYNDFLVAFKAREEIKKTTLGSLKAKITEAEKANKNVELTDEETLKVVLASIKQRKQSIDEFIKAERIDLVERESAELNCLNVYLPIQLNKEDIKNIVEKLMENTPSDSNKNKFFGMITGAMNKKFAGQFDNKVLTEVLNDIQQIHYL